MKRYGYDQDKINIPPDQIFRITKDWKDGSVFVLIFIVGLIGWMISLKDPSSSFPSKFIALMTTILIMPIILYNLAFVFKYHIEIYSDKIRNIHIFRTGELLIREIEGFRILQNEEIVLLPKDTRTRKIKLCCKGIEHQSDLWEWLNQNLIHLDMKDFQLEMKQIQEDRWQDKSMEYVYRKLDSAKKWASILTVFSFIVFLWAHFYPRPYKCIIFILMIFPLVALGVGYYLGRLFKIYDFRYLRVKDTFQLMFPNISAILIFPGMAFALRTFCDWNILCWNKAFWPVASFSAYFAFLLFSVTGKVKWKVGTMIISIIISILYGYPAAIFLNGMLDTSTPSIYKTTVIKKQLHRKGCFLRLSPWGTEIRKRIVFLNECAPHKYEPGDTIEVTVKDGHFGIPWVTVD